jgi:hypothetical protein
LKEKLIDFLWAYFDGAYVGNSPPSRNGAEGVRHLSMICSTYFKVEVGQEINNLCELVMLKLVLMFVREEVYIEQPEGFQLLENIDYVCKLKKALYGLKQAPRAWYSRLDKYLHQTRFRKGSADNNLYIKVSQGNILLIEVYVDDIIFGSDDDRLSQKFAKDMKNEFEMSLLGELSFFLGLQICQSNQRIFISQTKYIREMLKRFGMEDCKPVITPMQTSFKLRKDDDSKSTDQKQYRSRIGSLPYVTTSRLDVM